MTKTSSNNSEPWRSRSPSCGSNGGGGHGLEGLSERVEELGGSIEAGRRAEGGYRLAVRVPVGRR